jgi:hypothetical protein
MVFAVKRCCKTLACPLCGKQRQGCSRREGEGTARDGTIITRPMVYDLVIRKAKSRLFNLYDKLKQSPFMKEIDESFTKEIENARQSLF